MRGFFIEQLSSRLLRSRTTRQRRSNQVRNTEQLEARALLTLAVPELSSLPGADHTIFLDFDGHTVTNTAWNGFYNQTTLVAPAYSRDANRTDFSATELADITDAYHRIAEDFRPFNVNITTVEPSADRLIKSSNTDSRWGIRLIMTNEAAMVTDPAERSGAGGIAYINSFNWDSDTPSWVFTTGGKPVAEAASHEAGHALGLAHDGEPGQSYYRGHGSGDTGWASIMGVGYYENVTQWDDGTYTGANNTGTGANYGKGESDLDVITNFNGFGYRADDHGIDFATGSDLTISDNNVSGTGVIETASDVDAFRFRTGAGAVSFDLTPFTPGPNLDIKAELFDSSGNLIASSNPQNELTAGFDLTLEQGDYYITVDGVGAGNPTGSSPTGYTDYASIGQYSISGTVVEEIDPFVTVEDVEVDEGAGVAQVQIRLVGDAQGVTVGYSTNDGSALADQDYTAVQGTVFFGSAGVRTIQVPINDDLLDEDDESFLFNLSSATGGVFIDDGEATITIKDDDEPNADAGLSISDASVVEGDPRSTRRGLRTTYSRIRFKVTLNEPSTQTVSVRYSTSDGSATLADRDYRARQGTVRFRPGQTTKYVSVWVQGDLNFEGDESLNVTLHSARNAPIADAVGVGTIVNDDFSENGPGFGATDGQPQLIVDPMSYFTDGHDHSHHDHDHAGHSHDDGCCCANCVGAIQEPVVNTLVSTPDNTSVFSIEDRLMVVRAESSPDVAFAYETAAARVTDSIYSGSADSAIKFSMLDLEEDDESTSWSSEAASETTVGQDSTDDIFANVVELMNRA